MSVTTCKSSNSEDLNQSFVLKFSKPNPGAAFVRG